ncbi:hydrolase of HD superfamily [Sporothrix schenckii 1099-18]|uniref:5'-deoxynucleotidase n=2 Tax=Sporothrix schenckii TaxID=29908 RepID=U7Q2A4_SPOS1|nr:hydrolase of HD superfamily [Sporothrix schenckii 1099-18]ERT01968.1 hypothetical protein HMPREF1624_00263 [Sporothrix schenckii ATCC 58251]KJR80863.1 hydrolase of HD superfamily [Sporothrix schenckii 1099-18]
MADHQAVDSLSRTSSSTDDVWTVDKALVAHGIEIPENVTSPITFFHILERLKTTKRQGWLRHGINAGESIADHMHRMGIMVLFAPPSVRAAVNLDKCLKMALLHDVAETIVGDITPSDGVPRDEKSRREAITVDFFVDRLLGSAHGGDDASAAEMRAVWNEFESGTIDGVPDSASPERAFVQDLDKIEMLLQMSEYERRHGVNLDEFTYSATKIRMPEMRAWADEILAGRVKQTTAAGPTVASREQQDEYYGK